MVLGCSTLACTQEKYPRVDDAFGQIQSLGFEVVDLADLEAGRAFARRAIADLGGLDGLVNNAGANFWYGVAGATEADQRDAEIAAFLSTPEGYSLSAAFTRITDGATRRRLVQLVRTLAEAEDA